MKKHLKHLKRIRKKISEKLIELNEVKTTNYYDKVSNELARIRDINEIEHELKDLYNAEYTALENVQLALEKEKYYNQTKMKRLIISTNKYEKH